ncbi:AraC family transcriptional regulator [Pseudomonas citronellolis]|uniref:AraC family transcriptional regulator n=1 Tax=Pseudomonas citronellolis TaxID=53408 RepID=A0A1A9KFB5_9PSED|nr:AraC family transcriptional regulator [Pseudomonas citronellolis]ANI15800.1 AraC family transcriptional regulator [Pseudomonas citronellolis]WRT82222.1 AraC family transcriptional regulator [Pseudomonas citronellolis]
MMKPALGPEERTATPRRRDSVAAYFVKAALHRLADRPQRAAELLAQAGIEPHWLDEPLHRVPAEAVTRLWLLLTEELGDEFFAFDSAGLPRGAFAMVCRSVLHEPDLGRALRQCLAGFNLFLRDIRAHLELRGNRAAIVLHTRIDDATLRCVAEEIYLSMVIGVACWLVGRRINPDRARFGHPQPPHGAEPLLWGPWIRFDADHTELEFNAQQLALPVIRNFASLKQFLRQAPEGVVVRFRNRSGLSAKVYRRLKAGGDLDWPSQAQMAAQLALSESAFRRQLEREGFSYQMIKHEVRRALAFECLDDARLSIAEIAARCGFQEPSAFHRAFRQWTGMSPGRYRADRAQGGD